MSSQQPRSPEPLEELRHLDDWLPEFVHPVRQASEKSAQRTLPAGDRRNWSVGGNSNSSFTSSWMASMENKFLGPLGSNDCFPTSTDDSFPSTKMQAPFDSDAWGKDGPIASFVDSTPTGSALKRQKRGREPSIQSHRSSGRLSASVDLLDSFAKDDSFLVRSSHRYSGFLGVDTVLAELNVETLPPGTLTKTPYPGSGVGLPVASDHNDPVILCVPEADRIGFLNEKVMKLWDEVPHIPQSQTVAETVHEDVVVEDPKQVSSKGIPIALRQQQTPGSYIVPHPDSPMSEARELGFSDDVQSSVSPESHPGNSIRLPGGGTVVGFAIRTPHIDAAKKSNLSNDSIGSATAAAKVRRGAGVKHYPVQETPSKHCHLCSRKPIGQHLVCSNYLIRECRKIICKKCFDKNKWDWSQARAESNRNNWQCSHCTSNCPQRASCKSYSIKNPLRPPKGKRARLLGLGSSNRSGLVDNAAS